MGKSARRPIKYYGVYTNHDLSAYGLDNYSMTMGVTKFTRLHNGTKMVHGTELPVPKSTHRVADGMHFYQDLKLAHDSIRRAEKAAKFYDAEIESTIGTLNALKLARKKAIELELSRHNINPSELED